MTETEYMTVSNLMRVRAALKIVQDITPSYGVTEEEKKLKMAMIYNNPKLCVRSGAGIDMTIN
jgi:hypothetical protein